MLDQTSTSKGNSHWLDQMLFWVQVLYLSLRLWTDTSVQISTAVSHVSAYSPSSPAVWPLALFVYFLLPDECTALWETSLQPAGASVAGCCFALNQILYLTDDGAPRVLTCETLAVFHLTIVRQSDLSDVLHNISAGQRNTTVGYLNKPQRSQYPCTNMCNKCVRVYVKASGSK